MSLFSSQRSAAPLTENEKIMILNAHKYFSEENSSSKKRQKSTLRKRVAEVLGVSESTVGRVIHKWNECKNGSFAEQKNIGRPRLQPSPDIITLLREKITNANKAGTPVSTPILRQYLAENGFTLSNAKEYRENDIYLMRKLMTNPFLKITWNPVRKFVIKLVSKCF